jgi:RNA polymerase sigma-70 factor (ECF subfamily)
LKPGRPVERAVNLPDEVDLVRKAKSGDARAFGLLYDATLDRIYRYVFFRVTDAELAEDLTSQVFLKAWENLRRYKPGGPFVAWLYTIARNTVIDHYRTRKQSVPLDQTVIKEDPALDEKVDLKHDIGILQEAMQDLTDEQREVLTLRFLADMETGEIAERMQKSEGAIRALQMRALQALAKAMGTNRKLEV